MSITAPKTARTFRKLEKGDYLAALQIYKRLTERYNEYLEECEADRAAGYRPHYCEHGTNQHTDWDNICGACEDGYSMRNPQARREEALRQARQYHDQTFKLAQKAMEFMADLDRADSETVWGILKGQINDLSLQFGVKSPWEKEVV